MFILIICHVDLSMCSFYYLCRATVCNNHLGISSNNIRYWLLACSRICACSVSRRHDIVAMQNIAAAICTRQGSYPGTITLPNLSLWPAPLHHWIWKTVVCRWHHNSCYWWWCYGHRKYPQQQCEPFLSMVTELCSSMQWCNKNDNYGYQYSKSCSMVVESRQKLFQASKSQNDISLDIRLNSNPIPCVTETKMLGVYVDSVLSWSEHIKHS